MVLAGGLSASQVALGQEGGFYLGGSLGQATFKEFCVPDPTVLSCDDKDTAWKIFGGYSFNRNVGVEATYINWGKATGSVLSGGTVENVSAEQTSMGLALVGSLDFSPQFSGFIKGGFLRTEQKLPASSRPKREETEIHYGLGLKFSFAPAWAVRGEWERTEKLKVEMFSIGVEYRF